MTTVVAKAFPDRVEILSDGGLTNQVTGAWQLMDRVNKVRGLFLAPMAVSGVGPWSYTEKVAAGTNEMARAAGGRVDATVAIVKDTLVQQKRKAAPTLQASHMLVAGISEKHGPKIWDFVTGPHNDRTGAVDSQFVPWKLNDSGQHIVIGSWATEADVEMLEAATSLESLVPLMDAFRARDRRRCNSHIDLTVVRPYGVETKRLHVWDEDRIGEPMWSPEDWLQSQSQ